MRTLLALMALLIAGLVTGCGTVDKQWMKVGESYTTAEFRRDYAECSKGGRLDEDCLRARGWVELSPTKADKAADAPPPAATSPKYSSPATKAPGSR
jgi:hypothetical protein